MIKDIEEAVLKAIKNGEVPKKVTLNTKSFEEFRDELGTMFKADYSKITRVVLNLHGHQIEVAPLQYEHYYLRCE